MGTYLRHTGFVLTLLNQLLSRAVTYLKEPVLCSIQQKAP